jgi:hypothetical protein
MQREPSDLSVFPTFEFKGLEWKWARNTDAPSGTMELVVLDEHANGACSILVFSYIDHPKFNTFRVVYWPRNSMDAVIADGVDVLTAKALCYKLLEDARAEQKA